jgi:phosphatidylglycerophosphatase A
MSASDLPDRPGREASPLTRLIATGFYVGYIPWGSGTFGSLLGLLLCLPPGVLSSPFFPLAVVAVFFIGVYVSGRVALAEGHRLTRSAAAAKEAFQPGVHAHPDPSIVVIDEIVGMWISLLWLPVSLPSFVIAFLAFRIFDVTKPQPANLVEHFPGGWGIMLDDLVAAVYANLGTRIVLFLLTPSVVSGLFL